MNFPSPFYMSNTHIPDRGDVIWMDFDPVLGSEQGGRRPALVITPAFYNDRSGICIVCPVTSRVKGYPFEVAIPPDLPVAGFILVDQIKCQDWRFRNIEKITSLQSDQIREVQEMLKRLLLG